MGLFGAVEEIRHKNGEFFTALCGFPTCPCCARRNSLNATPPDSDTSHGSGGCLLRGGVYAYRVLRRDSRRGGRPPLFFKNSIPRPGLTKLGFDFLVLGKLGRRHFLTLGSGMGFPPLVHPVSHGLRDQTVGLCRLADRAGTSQRPPDTTCCLNSSLYLDADIIQILPHMFD